jgi:uncharacterized protein YxjI
MAGTTDATPWTGSLLDVDGSVVEAADLALVVADRRGCPVDAVDAELATIAQRFDVDAVYVARR